MTIRVVIDASIFINYLLVGNDRSGTIVQIFESISSGRYQLIRSDRLMAELRSAVEYKPRLRYRISHDDLQVLISLVEEVSIPVHLQSSSPLEILGDRKDNYLLEMANDADADFLITGDRDLQDIRDQLERPAIVTPREFLDLLDQLQVEQLL